MSKVPDDILSVPFASQESGRKILIMTADNTEDLEFFYPYYRFIEAGFSVDVVTPEGGSFKGKTGYEFKKAGRIAEADAANYDMLYIPGGKAPAALKKVDAAVKLTQAFTAQGKPIAALCHGPQLLAEAHVIDGVKLTGYPEIEEELREAGGNYVDAKTVVDGQFITARWPADMPFHMDAALAALH